jgi:hypothetical protein
LLQLFPQTVDRAALDLLANKPSCFQSLDRSVDALLSHVPNTISPLPNVNLGVEPDSANVACLPNHSARDD